MSDGLEEQVPIVQNFSSHTFDFLSLIRFFMLNILLYILFLTFLPFLLLLLLLEKQFRSLRSSGRGQMAYFGCILWLLVWPCFGGFALACAFIGARLLFLSCFWSGRLLHRLRLLNYFVIRASRHNRGHTWLLLCILLLLMIQPCDVLIMLFLLLFIAGCLRCSQVIAVFLFFCS